MFRRHDEALFWLVTWSLSISCQSIYDRDFRSLAARKRQLEKAKVAKMADLEAVLADVSYLMAMEKSKSTPAARASKKIVLPDPS